MKKSNFALCVLAIAFVSFLIMFQPWRPRIQLYAGNISEYSVVILEKRGLFSAPFEVCLCGDLGSLIMGSYSTCGRCESISLSDPHRVFEPSDPCVRKELALLEQAHRKIKTDANKYP